MILQHPDETPLRCGHCHNHSCTVLLLAVQEVAELRLELGQWAGHHHHQEQSPARHPPPSLGGPHRRLPLGDRHPPPVVLQPSAAPRRPVSG